MNTILIAIIAFLAGGGVAALLVHNISRKGRQEALAIKDEELLTKENEAASLRNEIGRAHV